MNFYTLSLKVELQDEQREQNQEKGSFSNRGKPSKVKTTRMILKLIAFFLAITCHPSLLSLQYWNICMKEPLYLLTLKDILKPAANFNRSTMENRYESRKPSFNGTSQHGFQDWALSVKAALGSSELLVVLMSELSEKIVIERSMATIISAFRDSLLRAIQYCATAKDAWDNPNRSYSVRIIVNKLKSLSTLFWYKAKHRYRKWWSWRTDKDSVC